MTMLVSPFNRLCLHSYFHIRHRSSCLSVRTIKYTRLPQMLWCLFWRSLISMASMTASWHWVVDKSSRCWSHFGCVASILVCWSRLPRIVRCFVLLVVWVDLSQIRMTWLWFLLGPSMSGWLFWFTTHVLVSHLLWPDIHRVCIAHGGHPLWLLWMCFIEYHSASSSSWHTVSCGHSISCQFGCVLSWFGVGKLWFCIQ